MPLDLTWEQVSYWRANRHFLIERSAPDRLLQVVSRLGGIQAQLMSGAELALWARVKDLEVGQIHRALWEERTLVKTWAMRGTLHFLNTADFPLYVVAMRLKNKTYLRESWLKYHGVTLAQMEAIIANVPLALDKKCLTREQLAQEIGRLSGMDGLNQALLSGWGAVLKPSSFKGDLCFGPNQARSITFTRPDQWLPLTADQWQSAVQDDKAARRFVLETYLAAYGPATQPDFARWWGVEPGKARPFFKDLSDRLEEVRVGGDWTGWALATDIAGMEATPAEPGFKPDSVRLLPNFDPYVVAIPTSQRGRFLSEDMVPVVYRRAGGWISPVVMANGRFAGVWSYEQKGPELVVSVDYFTSPPNASQLKDSLLKEGERLARFLNRDISGVRIEEGLVNPAALKTAGNLDTGEEEDY